MKKKIKYLIEDKNKFNFDVVDYQDIDSDLISNNEINDTVYRYQPKTKRELREIIKKYLEEGKYDFNDINVSKIHDFSFLFVDLDPDDIDISGWDVSNATNFFGMFMGCVNFNSDLSNWDVSNVVSFERMFQSCTSLGTDIRNWDVRSGVNFMLINAFAYDPTSDINILFNIKEWQTTNDNPVVFEPVDIEELQFDMKMLARISHWNFNCINTSKLTDLSFLFKYDREVNDYNAENTSLKQLNVGLIENKINMSEWDVSNVKNFRGLFNSGYMYGTRNKMNMDLSNWDVSNGENFSRMFYGCQSISDNGISNWNVSSGIEFGYMFCDCTRFNADLSGWDVSNAKNMEYMFDACRSFNADLSGWDVSNCKNFHWMFYGCKKFTSDLSGWNVSNGEKFNYMFYNCENFTSDLSDWRFPNADFLIGLFCDCKSFTSDVSGWDVSGKTSLKSLFEGCEKFTSDVSNWDVSACEDFTKLFKNCHMFTSDVSRWDISSGKKFLDMFLNNYHFDSDFSNWKILPQKCKNMFKGCISLSNPPAWYTKKWAINESYRYLTESNLPDNNPIINFLKMVAAHTNGFQKKYYTDMLNDARSVEVVSAEDVFDQEMIDKIINYIRPQLKECYQNAYRLCDRIHDSKYEIKYCQGYLNFNGIPIEHAWNSVNGKYIDITKEYALGGLDNDEYVLIAEYDVNTMRSLAVECGTYDGLYLQQKKNEYK